MLTEMKIRLWIAVFALLVSAVCQAQTSSRPIRFAGEVESVDVAGKSATIKHGDIPGYMAAMTMEYSIDAPAVLKRLAPGDDIVATAYAGDTQLHKVRIVGHAPRKKSSK
jgi:Cu/Ag efflux protein CusF